MRPAGSGHHRGLFGQCSKHRIQQVPRAAPVQRRYRSVVGPAPDDHKDGSLRLGPVVVDLVGREHHRLARLFAIPGPPPHQCRWFPPWRRPQGERRRPHQPPVRPARQPGRRAPARPAPTPLCLRREITARPTRVVGDPIAGDAGTVLDNRLTSAEDSIDQGRLSDVGPTDHRQNGQRDVCNVELVGSRSRVRLGMRSRTKR